MLHRKRINTKEKAKVVAAAWETELIQFLAKLAVLNQDDVNNRLIDLQQDDLKNRIIASTERV